MGSFRAHHGEALNGLMTDILGALLHKGVLSLDLVAQDGMRVRAAATAPSFRRHRSVLAQADDPELSAAQHARRVAAARDFQRRIEEAIATVQEIQESRRPSAPAARASTTDAEARVMKMADGGFRPAYNVQLATAGSELGGPRTIVGVRVTNLGSDMDAVSPMLDDIERRVDALPRVLLADANHGGHDGIRDATVRGVEVLIPVPDIKKNPSRDQAATDEAIVAWRARAGLCELSNAHLRCHHGVDQFLVRGLEKVTCVVLLGAIASNLLQHAATLLS